MKTPRAHQNHGFTIVEVVIATVIFSIAIAGLFATVAALNHPAEESSEMVSAAYLGKQILDQLRQEIDADPSKWDTSGGSDELVGWLDPNGSDDNDGIYKDGENPLVADVVIDDITFKPVYQVEADPDGTAGRKVTLTISW